MERHRMIPCAGGNIDRRIQVPIALVLVELESEGLTHAVPNTQRLSMAQAYRHFNTSVYLINQLSLCLDSKTAQSGPGRSDRTRFTAAPGEQGSRTGLHHRRSGDHARSCPPVFELPPCPGPGPNHLQTKRIELACTARALSAIEASSFPLDAILLLFDCRERL